MRAQVHRCGCYCVSIACTDCDFSCFFSVSLAELFAKNALIQAEQIRELRREQEERDQRLRLEQEERDQRLRLEQERLRLEQEERDQLLRLEQEERDQRLRLEQERIDSTLRELTKRVPTVISILDLTPSQATTSKNKELQILFDTLNLPDKPVADADIYKSNHSQQNFSFSWTGKTLERQGYDPLQEHLESNGFTRIYCVESGQRLVMNELFDVNIFNLRSKLGSHGEPLVAKVKLHGRTDFVALREHTILPEKSHILRYMVDYCIEVKRLEDMKGDSACDKCEKEAMLQLIGLCVDNPNSAPPVILTNMVKKHIVLYLDLEREDPLSFQIKKRNCSSILCAAHFALSLANKKERRGIARDFGRGPTPSTTPVHSVDAQDDDSKDLQGECASQDCVCTHSMMLYMMTGIVFGNHLHVNVEASHSFQFDVSCRTYDYADFGPTQALMRTQQRRSQLMMSFDHLIVYIVLESSCSVVPQHRV